MSDKLVDIIGKVGGKTPVGKVIRTGSNLIKLFRGETKTKNKLDVGEMLGKGRWFTPDKDYAKYFANVEKGVTAPQKKGDRILKVVNVSEEDYKKGNKLYRKVYGENHCIGTHCILPKKNLKDVKTKEFNEGGAVIGKGKDYIKDLL